MTIRICMWSGPRNISTALMYAFAQRSDTMVVDEPFYGHYLSHTAARAYHPGAEEIVATMENDWRKVVNDTILAPTDASVIFFKMMTHHIMDIDWAFMQDTVNVLLTRNPYDMLLSYVKKVAEPELYDVGYADHIRLLDYLQSVGQMPPVLEAETFLQNPRLVLQRLCQQIGIPFAEGMLSWEAGARPEDGVWAKYWYRSVHQSTGFRPYQPRTELFPERLRPLLAECTPYYEQLAQVAIQAE